MSITEQLEKTNLASEIDAFISKAGKTEDADLYRDMIITVFRMIDDSADRGNLKIANVALRELRYGFKVFNRYTEVKKISIFGSDRNGSDSPAYQMAVVFASRMV